MTAWKASGREERMNREQPAERMPEQCLAVGIDLEPLADFATQLAGQEVEELVQPPVRIREPRIARRIGRAGGESSRRRTS